MSKKNRGKKTAPDKNGDNSESLDNSPYIYQDEKLKRPLDVRCRYKLTERQIAIIETAIDKFSQVIMIDGYWGTGKSMLAVLASLQLMNEKKLTGITYLRNPLEASNTAKVGTLPGTLDERMETYNAILFDKLNEFLPKCDVDLLKKEERLECLPVGLIQGKTFSCKAVIVDEATSLSYDDMMLVISRMGEHSKLFIVGDSTFQLSIGNRSGFRQFFDIFNDEESRENGVFCFELKEKDDIRRSGLVRFVMEKTGVIKRFDAPKDEPMFPPA